MDIQGRRILVLGGFGMVGMAVCRELLERRPAHLVVSSLFEHEARGAVETLTRLHPEASLEAAWGNIFVRQPLKDLSREAILRTPEHLQEMLTDVYGDLDEGILKEQTLYRLVAEVRPDVVIDCVNTATALAYQNIYASSREVLGALEGDDTAHLKDAVARLVASQYTPQLIRHVQILYAALRDSGCGMYVKVGTSGTGGMGLNIPYTHSEERPSRVLLSKTAMAGAHSLLLFLMGRTPDAPITKEIKPSAAIAWKGIGRGPIRKGGRPIPLWDVPLEQASAPAGELPRQLPEDGFDKLDGDRVLESVFIDTGENGLFAAGEFAVISSIGQMEFVTPEEIATAIIREIAGANTGLDIVSALDMAVLGPTYRAGAMRAAALERLRVLEEEGGTRSVAFELLGPPRLSKLLFEAELLRRTAGTLTALASSDPETLAGACRDQLERDPELRAQMLSIGIPVLLPDGRLLRGPSVKIPPDRGLAAEPVSPERLEVWADAGWVDLRPSGLDRWCGRARTILEGLEAVPEDETSSRHHHDRSYWRPDHPLDIGKAVAWVFIHEDRGERMK